MSDLHYQPYSEHLLRRLENTQALDLERHSVRTPRIQDLLGAKIDTALLSQIDLYDWRFLMSNLPERGHFNHRDTVVKSTKRQGIFRSFYRDPYSFLTVNTKDFFLKVDPLLHFQLGDDSKDDNLIFQNTRGLRLRGVIDQKVYFATQIIENQARFNNFVEAEISRIQAIPGQGFFKPYQSGIIDNLNGWDFLNASGYLGVKISKSIDLQLGHGRHFIGEGIRSLLLSDYANNYLYLKLDTKIWKFRLQNIFAELSATSNRTNIGNTLLPKKYMALHYLDFSINSKFTLGLFESVIFSRENNFEFQYLNPVILYRSVEQFLDSPDNVILGLNVKWRPSSNLKFYGQLLIDELKTSEAFGGRGWWGNKVGYQTGVNVFDLFGVLNLDFQIEHNTARPFTYAHRGSEPDIAPPTSYSHYNQALAHPYGANFRETLFSLKFRPHRKVFIESTFLHSLVGTNPSLNIGRDILLNYESRENDFGNFTGQGARNVTNALYLNISWMFFPNYYLDLSIIARTSKIDQVVNQQTQYWGLGMRANLFPRHILL